MLLIFNLRAGNSAFDFLRLMMHDSKLLGIVDLSMKLFQGRQLRAEDPCQSIATQDLSTASFWDSTGYCVSRYRQSGHAFITPQYNKRDSRDRTQVKGQIVGSQQCNLTIRSTQRPRHVGNRRARGTRFLQSTAHPQPKSALTNLIFLGKTLKKKKNKNDSVSTCVALLHMPTCIDAFIAFAFPYGPRFFAPHESNSPPTSWSPSHYYGGGHEDYFIYGRPLSHLLVFAQGSTNKFKHIVYENASFTSYWHLKALPNFVATTHSVIE